MPFIANLEASDCQVFVNVVEKSRILPADHPGKAPGSYYRSSRDLFLQLSKDPFDGIHVAVIEP